MPIILNLIVILALSSCVSQSPEQVYELQGRTMGTTYSVKFTSLEKKDWTPLQAEIDHKLKDLNQQMSTYIKDSQISEFNRAGANQWLSIGDWFAKTLTVSLRIAQETKGYFDPTIGPLVNLWGFGPKKKTDIPSDHKISETMEFIGYQKVKLRGAPGNWQISKTHPKVYLDLSASAKGFGVDVISDALTQAGFPNHMVEIGGEIRTRGQKKGQPWIIAIEKPHSAERSVQQILHLGDQSLATSGNYRNFFESGGKTYSHTIDFQTGKPVEHKLLSVSVVHKNCVEADAMATALMAMGPQKAREFAKKRNLAALMIVAKGQETEIFKTHSFEQVEVTR